MKKLLSFVFIVVLGLVGYGFFINVSEPGSGEKFIGIGVFAFAFILMPLFIYYRYHGKDLSRYSLKNLFEKQEDKK